MSTHDISLPAVPDLHMELTEAQINNFLQHLQRNGYTPSSIGKYRHALQMLYASLPDEKRITRSTLSAWREQLQTEGYAVRTVNGAVSAANSFFTFLGRKEFQLSSQLVPEEGAERPALTREEYHRLLHAAHRKGKRRTYMLIRVFVLIGLPLQALPCLTVESLHAQAVSAFSGASLQQYPIPRGLCDELLAYAEHAQIDSGPLFISRSGKPLSRTNVLDMIHRICLEAEVPHDKANPRSMRGLHDATVEAIEARVRALAEEEYERFLQTEEELVRWDL